MTGASDDSRVQELLVENAKLKDELESVRVSNLDCMDKLCGMIRELQSKESFVTAVEGIEKKLVVRLGDLRLRVDGMEKKMHRMDEKSSGQLKTQIEEVGRGIEGFCKQLEEKIHKVFSTVSSHYGNLRRDAVDARQLVQSARDEAKVGQDIHEMLVKLQTEMSNMKALKQAISGKRSRTLREMGCQTEGQHQCTLCDFESAAVVPRLLHELSIDHYTKLLENLVGEADRETGAKEEGAEEGEKCKICECSFPTREAWLKHLATKSHVEKVTADLKDHSGDQFVKTIHENLSKISRRTVVVDAIETALGKSLRAVAEHPLPLDEGYSREPDFNPAKRRRSMGQEANSGDRESPGGPNAHPLAITPYSLRQGQEHFDLLSPVQALTSALHPVHRSPLVETPRTAMQRDQYNELAQLLGSLRQPQPVPSPSIGSLLQDLLQPSQGSQGNQVQDLINLLKAQHR